MGIFVNFKKKRLLKKKYRYTLKSKDALSKSEHLIDLSDKYLDLVSRCICNGPMIYRDDIEKFQKKSYKCKIKAEHHKNISEMYLDMKLDVETELNNLSYRKV